MGSVCYTPLWRAKNVIENLGRYTHTVAISNHRIAAVDEQEVSFTYKDFQDGCSTKTMTLRNEDFTKRFAQHILPHRFGRIRHYGILSSSWKRGNLQALQKTVHVQKPAAPVKTILHKCRCCKTDTLVTIDVFGKRGPAQHHFTGLQNAPEA